MREINNSQNQEGSSERSNNAQAKHSMSKADAKRAKQYGFCFNVNKFVAKYTA